jgi:hypothetical protein
LGRLLAGATLLVMLGATSLAAVPPGPGAAVATMQEDDDLDAFMEKVLERRVTNWEDLYRYTVRDREVIDVRGPGGTRIESQVGESTWYVREGYMVRSPDTLNGAKVGAEERAKAEERFLERARKREADRAEKAAAAEVKDGVAGEGADAAAASQGTEAGAEREYFLGFPFEPGHYYLAGFEDFEGQQVVRVEYYPQELFEDEGDVEDEDSAEWTERFQKTSRVTLWVLPERYQIVKVAYDNIGLDFLPYRWLVQVDDVRAELVMHQPFPEEDLWLPREIVVAGEFSVATGAYTMNYTLEYFDYQETDVAAKVRFRLPGVEQQDD